MIKKLTCISILTISLFANTEISLYGESISSFGNPYMVLFGEKNKSISVYSENKDIKLKVTSNYKGYKEDFIILKNETILNILKQSFGEEYKVNINKNSDISVNVISGKIDIDYMDLDNNLQSLREIVVELNVELIKNGIKMTKTISLDQTLGDSSKNYSGFITTDDKIDLTLTSINKVIQVIIEREIFNLIKEVK